MRDVNCSGDVMCWDETVCFTTVRCPVTLSFFYAFRYLYFVLTFWKYVMTNELLGVCVELPLPPPGGAVFL